MIAKNGKGVFGGVAVGTIKIFSDTLKTEKRFVNDTEGEIKRLKEAVEKAVDQLEALYKKTPEQVGKDEAQIFEIHKMMITDNEFVSDIEEKIKMGVNAEAAVQETGEKFSQRFKSLNDAYMSQRAVDVKDISQRLIKILSGKEDENTENGEKYIIAAKDLTPSQTMRMDRESVAGFVTEYGSENSHTSILARMMNIPAIIGIKGIADEIYDGKSAAIDGGSGTLYIEPNETTLKRLHDKRKKYEGEKELLQKFKGRETVTKDGKKIMLYANISNMTDLDMVLANDAEGIGLFRSEFIFLQRQTYPSEEEQFKIYKKAVEKMNGKRVIIRTIDIGADKQADYFDIPKEENPALGYRAIRICLDRPYIFKTQLRAILRAAAYGKAAVMFPMICTFEELKKAKEILKEAEKELEKEGINYCRNIEVGIMIETPAAAVISDVLAEECDFFSIGTNDLTQYTLAADRQNSKVTESFDIRNESVLRLIKMTAQNGHKKGIWVGICGELGADTSLTADFIKWGIDELSVSPVWILELRRNILEIEAK